ncbi:Heterokaryon incompatibility protein s [Cladophialophora carrionii]|uniref:Heterokaryon incompatibility protein s n=1 Tax=Cladophialophora carrionii TaxID=86049 RepID=A0A1C1CA10_9EURO|nr:Heterokaryon incompatibility protein s [Cladophialophora carrionii]
MAEAAGLVVGAVSLAGLFTNCVDCFEYVQMGRNFGKNYQRCLLKLDVVKLRLSRWAEAVNNSSNSHQAAIDTTRKAQQVGEILGEIIELFADAERVSAKYKAKASGDELVVYNPENELEPDILSVHRKMRALALKRQKRSSFTQKAAWALYEEKHFRRLIEDVTTLVDALLELFPATQERQRQLSAEEAEEMREERRLDALEDATEGVDQLLQNSVQHAIASQSGHTFSENLAMDNSRVRYGDEHASGVPGAGAGHRYGGNTVQGSSKVHYGNRFGGKSVLDD